MSSSSEQLPPTNGSVQVVLLDGGGFTTASDKIIHADGIDTTFYLYNWCFYIHHPDSGRNILWDLGISDVIPEHSSQLILNGTNNRADCQRRTARYTPPSC